MARSLDEKEIMYDVVSGVSVGAMNSGGVSLFPKGEEKQAT
jgi:predicted acylesterase/phospholipase RssA